MRNFSYTSHQNSIIGCYARANIVRAYQAVAAPFVMLYSK
jgi:hypothetical protein